MTHTSSVAAATPLGPSHAQTIGGETRELADSLPLIVWTARADGWVDFFNQRWTDYTGMSLDETMGQGWGRVLHPDDLQPCLDVWRHSLATGEPYEIEYRFKRASDGAYRWHLGRALPIRGADGRIVKWFGTGIDIDDYKKLLSEERSVRDQLAQSGRRFASLIDASADIVWTTDATGAVPVPQESWGQFTGQTADEYRQWGFLNAVHPDDRERTKQVWQASVALRQPLLMEHCLRRADGQWRDMAVRAVPVVEDDGSIQEWVGAHSDVTEQKRTEKERERARRDAEAALAQLEAVLTSAQDGIILSEPDGYVRMWNPAALAMHEYTTLEEACQPLSEYPKTFELLDTQSVPVPTDGWPLSRLMRGEPFAEYELQVRRRDTGTHWWASYTGSIVRDRDDTPLLLLLTVRDVSERRRMQSQRDMLLRRIEEAALKQRRFLREMLSSMTEGRLRLCDSPDDLPPTVAPEAYAPPLALTRVTIRTLRRQVDACCHDAGLPTDRQNDLVTAVGEAAMNAVVHAGGGEGRVYNDPQRGTVQVWVTDRGHGIKEDALHRATLEKGFSSVGTLGHGFWMMLKTADRVYLLTSASGTTVVMEQERDPPLPAWLQTTVY